MNTPKERATIYIAHTGSVGHRDKNCAGLANANPMTVYVVTPTRAFDMGITLCQKCSK